MADGAPATPHAPARTAGRDCAGAARLSRDSGVRRGRGDPAEPWTFCSRVSSRASWTSSSSATVAPTTPRRSFEPRATRCVCSSCVALQARRAPAWRRRGEGLSAVVPGRRRAAARVGGASVAGAPAVRGTRRTAASPLRGERRLRTGAEVLPRPIAGSGRPGLALGRGRVWALGDRQEPVRRPFRTWWRTISGWIGCSATWRWISSTARPW